MSTTSSATAAVMAKEKNVAAEPLKQQKDLVTSHIVRYTEPMEPLNMPISEFKAKCLGVVDDIASSGAGITLTKRGQPVARVIPIESVTAPLKDTWAGAVRITGDLVAFDLAADWEAAAQ